MYKNVIMKSKEIWKDVPNYMGMYKVSNCGRVKSLARKIHHPHTGHQTLRERILRYSFRSSNRPFVVLSSKGKSINFNISVLVAMAFLGHVPCGHKLVVDHIDNVPTNNHVDNLQLITAQKNLTKDRWRRKKK